MIRRLTLGALLSGFSLIACSDSEQSPKGETSSSSETQDRPTAATLESPPQGRKKPTVAVASRKTGRRGGPVVASVGTFKNAPRESRDREPSAEEKEQLAALGYVNFSPCKADASLRGAIVIDRERVSPGYSLYVAQRRCEAVLVDVEGEVVHTWKAEPCVRFTHAKLLPNGDLLAIFGAGRDPDRRYERQESPRTVVRMTWDGETIWKATLRGHHALSEVSHTEGSEVLVLTRSLVEDPGYLTDIPEEDEILVREELKGKIIDNGIVRIHADGSMEEAFTFLDLILENRIDFDIQPMRGGRNTADLFHANAIEVFQDTRLADLHRLYEVGNILVTLRHQDAVFIIDPRREEMIWAWGQGELSGPHDARLLENGNILIFDNALFQRASRVVEVDPRMNKIVWEYPGDQEGRYFFTPTRGSSQRLPNGNTLITSSVEGLAFEVTPEGDVVWEFWHPTISEDGRRGTLPQLIRYDFPAISRLLEQFAP